MDWVEEVLWGNDGNNSKIVATSAGPITGSYWQQPGSRIKQFMLLLATHFITRLILEIGRSISLGGRYWNELSLCSVDCRKSVQNDIQDYNYATSNYRDELLEYNEKLSLTG